MPAFPYGLCAFFLFFLLSGCSFDYGVVRTGQDWVVFRRGVPINTIVVLPMEAERLSEVPREAGELLTSLLFEYFSDIPQNKIAEVLPRVEGANLKERAWNLGRLVRAHAVVYGKLKRFQERRGSDKEVQKPASVAFELYVLDINSGDLMWWSRYDETQRKPRGDELFMTPIFVKTPRWLTAKELATQVVRWLAWDFRQAMYMALRWWGNNGRGSSP